MQTSEWNEATFTVKREGAETITTIVMVRVRWDLESLLQAGQKGCTPIDNPAPRWSACVHKLRRAGVGFETVTEPHAGAFAGIHARYFLRDMVERVVE